ncbi:MAG: UDP-N-acetylmuramoyl-tripeptide--D-alanyl-D-alanine ligase [Candidatus Pacebacteria bacterium]|nr:UDP-N-acetylmuramoyl-tripeptide--D-alanyl-D-alanine ligase [Candidatus Paceibacterota bacterium]
MKKILEFLLKIITILIIRKYHPLIIGVTGSVGKTSTKEAIYSAFSDRKNIRKSSGNLNTEVGAPLVFFKEKKPGKNIFEWFLIIIKGIFLVIKKDKDYPEMIISEMAADKPGDLDYLGSFIKPNISIITAVGEVPVHVEFYKSAKEVAEEKRKIIDATSKKGVVVLNNDDPYVSKMKSDKRNFISFGYSKEADVVIKEFETKSIKGSSGVISYKGQDLPFFLPFCIGDSFAYIAASVFSVGVSLGINPNNVIKSLKKIRPARGRMCPIKGLKNTFLIDGSYNASPLSTKSALLTLKKVEGKKKIAVIGDMLELGKYSANEHRKIGKLAVDCCDYLFAVGGSSSIVEKSALSEGMKRDKVFSFLKSGDAVEEIEKTISSGDVVLIKGSQGVRTEKIVYALMRDPEKAEEKLVRQDAYWKNK